LDVNHLPTVVYWVEVGDQNILLTERLVIQR